MIQFMHTPAQTEALCSKFSPKIKKTIKTLHTFSSVGPIMLHSGKIGKFATL